MFIQILNMGITAGYCILAVLIIRMLFCRAPRKYLYALWLVVAFRLVCPVSVSTEFSMFNLENFSQSVPEAGTANMEYIPADEMAGLQIHTGLDAADTLVNTQLSRVSAWTFHGISLKNLLYADGRYAGPVKKALAIGEGVWILGMAVFLIYFMVSLQRMKRSVRMAVKADLSGKCWHEPGYVPVYECDDLSSPFAMGLFHPRVYLPCQLEGQPRRMILLHEQYHIHRKDHWVKLFAFCLLAVYWFHPLVWLAWRGMCQDMEMSCDEKVLEALGEDRKKDYSLTLLSFASRKCSGSRVPLAFGEHDVERRIKHALHFKKPALWAGVLAAAAVIAALAVFGTNGMKKEPEEILVDLSAADLLYEAKNPYVGDAPANGRLLGAIAQIRPDSLFVELAFKTELQTSEEPYEFHFLLEENGETLRVDEAEAEALDADMQVTAALMLALIDNLGEVQWYYTIETPEGSTTDAAGYLDAGQAAEWCKADSIKEYGESPEKVQELLDLLAEGNTAK